jgi:hypothetical protein
MSPKERRRSIRKPRESCIHATGTRRRPMKREVADPGPGGEEDQEPQHPATKAVERSGWRRIGTRRMAQTTKKGRSPWDRLWKRLRFFTAMWAVQTRIASLANSEGWRVTPRVSQRRAPLISGAIPVVHGRTTRRRATPDRRQQGPGKRPATRCRECGPPWRSPTSPTAPPTACRDT